MLAVYHDTFVKVKVKARIMSASMKEAATNHEHSTAALTHIRIAPPQMLASDWYSPAHHARSSSASSVQGEPTGCDAASLLPQLLRHAASTVLPTGPTPAPVPAAEAGAPAPAPSPCQPQSAADSARTAARPVSSTVPPAPPCAALARLPAVPAASPPSDSDHRSSR